MPKCEEKKEKNALAPDAKLFFFEGAKRSGSSVRETPLISARRLAPDALADAPAARGRAIVTVGVSVCYSFNWQQPVSLNQCSPPRVIIIEEWRSAYERAS
jgi:hypothetical protein